MRPKSIILFVLALGCGLIAAVGINQVLAHRGATTTASGETLPIFVALTDVELGEPLTPGVLKLEPWPKDKVPQGTFSKLEDIEGRRPRTKLFAGEPILDNKLLSKDASLQGASGFIPKGMRVVSVKVDAVSGSSGLLLPGDRVDVLVQMQANPNHGIVGTTARTILQDIKVFAVNEVFRREHQDKEEEAITARTVSLLVKPDEAELITLANELGNIRLVMRSTEDDAVAETSGAGVHHLLGGQPGESHRSSESLMASQPLPSDRSGLLDMLNGKAPETTPPTEAKEPPPAVTPPWRMMLMIGSSAQQIEFDNDGKGIHTLPWGDGATIGPGPSEPAATPSEPAAEPTTDPASQPEGDEAPPSDSATETEPAAGG